MGASETHEARTELVEAIDEINSGDLMVMRLSHIDNDGVEMPVEVFSELSTATLGDQVAQRTCQLSSWDRVGVAVVQEENGISRKSVVIAMSDKVEVVRLEQILENKSYGVVGVRKMTPPYEDDLEQQTIAEMLESKSDRGMSALDKAVRDIDDIEYDTLVRTSEDDSVLQTFDRLQQWLQQKVEVGSNVEYCKQMKQTERKKRKVRNHAVLGRRGRRDDDDDEDDQMLVEETSTVELKAVLALHGVDFSSALLSDTPREQIEDLVKSNNLHEKKDKAGSGDESGANGEGAAAEDAENADGEFGLVKRVAEGQVSELGPRGKWQKASMVTRLAVGLEKQRLPSDNEWASLMSRALDKEVAPEQARRIQSAMQINMNLSGQQVEDMLLMMCGRRDIGNHLSAEIAMHLYRKIGILDSNMDTLASASKLAGDPSDLGDVMDALDVADLFGDSKDYLNDWCLHSSFEPVQILKHKAKEDRDMQGRVEQQFEGIWKFLEDKFNKAIE